MLDIKAPSTMTSEKPEVFCKGYLPLLGGSVSMLVSNGGVGKSFSSIRIAMHFVSENPDKKVALWLTEDSEGESFDRFKRLVGEFEEDKLFFNSRVHFITSLPLRFTKLEDGNGILTKEYHEAKDDLSNYDMVILDPLLQFNGCDENSNTHAGVLMGAFKSWAARENKIIMLLHHVTIYQDGGIKARGAGEWQNGCRCVYSLAYPCYVDNNGNTIPDKASKQRVFELIKDNGIGYRYFTNCDGNKEKTLDVFPNEETPL